MIAERLVIHAVRTPPSQFMGQELRHLSRWSRRSQRNSHSSRLLRKNMWLLSRYSERFLLISNDTPQTSWQRQRQWVGLKELFERERGSGPDPHRWDGRALACGGDEYVIDLTPRNIEVRGPGIDRNSGEEKMCSRISKDTGRVNGTRPIRMHTRRTDDVSCLGRLPHIREILCVPRNSG